MVKRLFSKKGISGVVTVVLMIALVMAAAAIVWGIVNNTLKGQVESSKSCFGNFDKVTINQLYTCYDSTADTFQFSISVADIEVEEIVVSVSAGGISKSYTLSDADNDDLTPYGSAVDTKIPGANEGKTYVASYTEEPDLIQIAPIINGQQCEVSDSVSEIDSCSSLA